MASMVTVLATWDEPENAEASLMHARLASVLGAAADVQRVSIDHSTGSVDVAIRLPHDLTGHERDLRATWVSAKVLNIVSDVFAEDDLVMKRIRLIEADQPPQSSPVRPRRGGDTVPRRNPPLPSDAA